MPIYEYACKHCGHTFDILQKMSDEPLSVCPECGEAELRKLLSAPNFRLKGSGWYETDFKSEKKRNLVEGDKAESADKPAEKAEAKIKDQDKGKDSKPEAPAKKSAAGSGEAAD